MITALIILSLVVIGIVAGSIALIKKQNEKISGLTEDLAEEKERGDMYFVAMQDNTELVSKAQEIDKQIEVKKNERKNLSKKDKISAANNRGSNSD